MRLVRHLLAALVLCWSGCTLDYVVADALEAADAGLATALDGGAGDAAAPQPVDAAP